MSYQQGYAPEPYEQVISMQRVKRRKTQLTPLQAMQQQARAQEHASNARAMNNACDRLEQWAKRARYGY